VAQIHVNRGDNGGETDNNAIITKILKLRAERAKLLGYATHAHIAGWKTPWQKRRSEPWS
jgi:Zn-dependent oligopeptidase